MSIIFSSQQSMHADEHASSKETQQSVTSYQLETRNIADGGEFLDDALRMKDQPFEDTDTKENE